MSLRLRLVCGFLLFSVLPLAGLALYSYSTSRAALRQAAWAEADIAARDLARRVGVASNELAARFRTLARMPLAAWSSTGSGESDLPAADFVDSAVTELGPALTFVQNLRFVPEAPQAPPATPTSAVAPAAPVPAPPAVPAIAPVAPVASTASGMAGEIADAVIQHAKQRTLDRQHVEALSAELARVRAEVARTIEQARVEAVEARRSERPKGAAGLPGEPASEPAAAGPTLEHRGGALSLADGTVTCELADGGRVVGKLEGKIKAKELLASVLAQADRDRGEIPFALDREANLYSANEQDGDRLTAIPAVRQLRGQQSSGGGETGDWIVLTRQDPTTGYRFGIARPVGAAIAALRAATLRNLFFGFGLIGLTLCGFVPLTGRLVRDVRRLEAGADEIARGNLEARIAVGRRDEIGRVATAFNRMATQLAAHQHQLLSEERRRKEDEIERRLLAAENERRRLELEEAREFQLALLPGELPRLAGLDLAVDMTTATEVGGDYYDFERATDGSLVLAIGDATGHGAAAGTLVTAVKTLFAATAAHESPAAFLSAANAAIHRMGLVRRAMALTVATISGRDVRLSAAGMPPLLHYRAAEQRVAELALAGTPLGARAEFPYAEAALALAAGDALLFLSDGLPELPNADGEPFGYERLAARFAELAAPGGRAAAIVSGLRQTVREWGGDRPPVDDVTLVVLVALPA